MSKIKNLGRSSRVTGTSYTGSVHITYEKLVSLFGDPLCGNDIDEYKTDAEWILDIDGDVVAIYNYKDGKNYLGDNGKMKEHITDWHVGSKSSIEYYKLKEYIDLHRFRQTDPVISCS